MRQRLTYGIRHCDRKDELLTCDYSSHKTFIQLHVELQVTTPIASVNILSHISGVLSKFWAIWKIIISLKIS